ncbi:hypothetical protein [Streptomyces antimicrobicus]|uniref:Bulb-type lectin domain-containing protein n=1 Tax=Streptomyces antimicrobicus TaxID=2883108 RepID=A0ABS8B8H0_9ACTN|nr:hypothetical protein [Streptomyces antimicrobicus]MCB5180899.1 hypothetical protein [Streptomyces antimicrobicus]
MLTKLRRVAAGALAVTALAAGGVLAGAGSASAAHSYGDRLYRGESLSPGESISRMDWNPYINGYIQYKLVMQTDGNLVQYKTDARYGFTKVCWASGTNNGARNYAIYQGDGNFVVYTPWNQALWASNTMGLAGETVDINRSGVTYVGHTPISGAC